MLSDNDTGPASIITILTQNLEQHGNPSEQEVNLIRLSCSIIREMYRLNLKFKDSLKSKDEIGS